MFLTQSLSYQLSFLISIKLNLKLNNTIFTYITHSSKKKWNTFKRLSILLNLKEDYLVSTSISSTHEVYNILIFEEDLDSISGGIIFYGNVCVN